MTVDDVIERALRRYLTPAFDQPVGSTVKVVQSDTSLKLTVAPFDTVEYSDAIAPGVIVEVGYELMTVTGVSGTDPIVLDVVRGAYGTPISEHLPGDRVIVAPQFPRHDLWLAASDEIERLHPDLWSVKTEQWTDQSFYDVPDETVDIVDVVAFSPDGHAVPVNRALLRERTDGTKYITLNNVTTPWSVRAQIAVAPIRPSDPADDLADLNVLERWADIVAMGIAIQHVTGQNVSDLRADYLTETMETQVTEAVSPRNLETGLRRARLMALDEERRRLRTQYQARVRMRSPLGA